MESESVPPIVTLFALILSTTRATSVARYSGFSSLQPHLWRGKRPRGMTTVSSRSYAHLARTVPPGSQTQPAPQNSMARGKAPSCPIRLTAATYTPLAMAWLRWIVSHAECGLAAHSAFSAGEKRMRAP